MKLSRFINGWTLMTLLLIAIIVASGMVIWSKSTRSQAIEISLTPAQEPLGRIYVGGAVNNPGFYPLYSDDSIEDVIQAAGGFTDGADLTRVKLSVSIEDNEKTTQKVNINRAETWLLEALPGIGGVRAVAIIEYRRQHGLFRDINELMKVPGIGSDTFELIKNLVTISD